MIPTCQWFLKCTNEAAGLVPHPILGAVPICWRCADRVDETANVGPFPVPDACEAPGDNHSNDLLTVYHGRLTPTILCGYHEQRGGYLR